MSDKELFDLQIKHIDEKIDGMVKSNTSVTKRIEEHIKSSEGFRNRVTKIEVGLVWNDRATWFLVVTIVGIAAYVIKTGGL